MRKWVDNLLGVLTSWGCDRWVHLVASLAIALLLTVVFNIVIAIAFSCRGTIVVGLISTILTVLIGFIKELWDKNTTGLFDIHDFAADCIGAALFFIIYSL